MCLISSFYNISRFLHVKIKYLKVEFHILQFYIYFKYKTSVICIKYIIIKWLYFLSDIIESKFVCPNNCGRSYKRNCTVRRHLKFECGIEPKFECFICYKKFSYQVAVKKHLISVHKKLPYT